jgi:hypothetical protein
LDGINVKQEIKSEDLGDGLDFAGDTLEIDFPIA